VEAVTGDSEEPSTLRRWLGGVDAVVDLRVCVPVGARALFARSWRECARLREPVADLSDWRGRVSQHGAAADGEGPWRPVSTGKELT